MGMEIARAHTVILKNFFSPHLSLKMTLSSGGIPATAWFSSCSFMVLQPYEEQVMSDTQNGFVAVFPTALSALPRQRQGLGEAWRGSLGQRIQSAARATDHVASITGIERAGLREVGLRPTDQPGSI